MFIPIEQVREHEGERVQLRGWAWRQREGKGTVFIVLRDVTGVVQCVVKEEKLLPVAQQVQVEASLELSGTVRKDTRAPGGFEIQVTELRIVGPSDKFPITEYQSTEHLLDVRHLWIRSRRQTAIFKVRSEVTGAIHEYFRGKGFFEIQSPSLTGSACEGGSTLFAVKYFDQKAYLTQSWQLYAEALIASLEKIYCIAPSFRAEKSRTRRHLTEYWHAEAEAAWLDHEGNLALAEGLVRFVVQAVLKKRAPELQELGRDTSKLSAVAKPFPRIAYAEALRLLAKDGVKLKWGEDLGADEERQLTTHFETPFFVTNYPKGIKAFYMLEDPHDPRTVLNMDLLAPEGYGEIIGGSARETDLKKLVARIKETGGKVKDYEWYLDTRRYGSVPHAGFGLGVERLVMWICGIDHVRDAIAFPRVINRLYP